MTREIKFRAWDHIDKEMVYESTAKSFFGHSVSNYDILRKYEVVMQFTGLIDRNGVDIYEGDLVQHEAWDYPFEVIFNQEKARFSCKMKTGLTQHIDNKQLTVVGNIYEGTTATPTGEDVGE
jgi:hypothetical protein